MKVIEAIERRREITRFRPKPIPEETFQALLHALHLAPAGNNALSRESVVVRERGRLDALANTTPYMAWLREAALGVVIVANPTVSKYWLQDATLAGGFLWLAAVEQGLGMAWGAVYHSEDVAESERRENYARGLLAIPAIKRVVAILGIGYPAIEPMPKKLHPKNAVFHFETYDGASKQA
ncbi:MAG: nitroreductase family protein [Verrucomicrobia bacterium]|nr:nitroreductase family protein [Verrucomicrobiota bacterium]MDE3100253.1 nitroreductase family protein [Verrucomicrobiota bacterium]